MTVLQFPPSASRSKWVSFELRYGTWSTRFDWLRSPNDIITLSSTERDLFMNVASRITVPVDFVFLNLSEPARSTRCIFDRCKVAEDKEDVSVLLKLAVSIFKVNTACDLDDRSFIACDPIALCASPSNHNDNASSSEDTSFVVKPRMKTPESGPASEITHAGAFFGSSCELNKSMRFSLYISTKLTDTLSFARPTTLRPTANFSNTIVNARGMIPRFS